MRSIYNIFCIILLVTAGFIDKQFQPTTSNVVDSIEKIYTIEGIIQDDKPYKKSKILTHEQLYSEGETIFGNFAKLVSDSLTMKKLYGENYTDSVVNITLYHQKNRIIVVVDRVSNIRKEMITNTAFYFDENNNCVADSKWSKTNPMEYTNSINWGTLIRFDVNYNKIDLTPSQKRQIIQSAKTSLDSVMKHFPEFNYSMNWK